MGPTGAQLLPRSATHATGSDTLLISVAIRTNALFLLWTLIFSLTLIHQLCNLNVVLKSIHSIKYHVDPEHLFSKAWFELVNIGNMEVQFKMDTGAEVNIMPKKLLDKMFNKNYKLRPTSIVLEAFGGTLLRPVGLITLYNCQLNNIRLDLEFVVADVESVPLLSLNACEDFGLVNRVNSKVKTSTSKICKISIIP